MAPVTRAGAIRKDEIVKLAYPKVYPNTSCRVGVSMFIFFVFEDVPFSSRILTLPHFSWCSFLEPKMERIHSW